MFSLWDERSLDPVAEYETLGEALALVREGIELNGPGDTETLSLVRDSPGGTPVQIAQGRELAALATTGQNRQRVRTITTSTASVARTYTLPKRRKQVKSVTAGGEQAAPPDPAMQRVSHNAKPKKDKEQRVRHTE